MTSTFVSDLITKDWQSDDSVEITDLTIFSAKCGIECIHTTHIYPRDCSSKKSVFCNCPTLLQGALKLDSGWSIMKEILICISFAVIIKWGLHVYDSLFLKSYVENHKSPPSRTINMCLWTILVLLQQTLRDLKHNLQKQSRRGRFKYRNWVHQTQEVDWIWISWHHK